MTIVDITKYLPSKAKMWVGLFGSLLTGTVPLVLGVEQYLPVPVAAAIGGVLALLTALGIYHAPYDNAPAAPAPAIDAAPAAPSVIPTAAPQVWSAPAIRGQYQNPWKRKQQ